MNELKLMKYKTTKKEELELDSLAGQGTRPLFEAETLARHAIEWIGDEAGDLHPRRSR